MKNSLWSTLLPWLPPWLIVAGLAIGAVAFALIAHRILFALAARIFPSSASFHRGLVRGRAIAKYAFVVVAMSLVLPFAPVSETIADDAHRVLLAAFIIFVGWLAVLIVNQAMDRYVRRFKVDVTDNLLARRAVTQVTLFQRVIDVAIITITISLALMSFESVRQVGVSIFASAGVAGIAVGLAARPVLGNLIAGMQIAITQPMRIDDVLIVNGEYGTVEEIRSTYVVMKLWDQRRLVVPLSYFFDNPFENWTRRSSDLIGTAFIYADYSVPVTRLRAKAEEIVKSSNLWNRKVFALQVTDVKESTMEIRVLASAANSAAAFDLRCHIREKLLAFMNAEYPASLPKRRQQVVAEEDKEAFEGDPSKRALSHQA